MKQRTYLITGATKGIGRALSKLLADQAHHEALNAWKRFAIGFRKMPAEYGGHMKTTFAAATFAAIASISTAAGAHGPEGHEETIEVLQQQPPQGAHGMQAVMLKVSYAPGKKSAGHMHPGPVFAYVLDGEVESQLEGGPKVVYKAGQSWYEAPGAHHIVSRNASQTRPATLLVWMVKGEKDAPVLPLPKK